LLHAGVLVWSVVGECLTGVQGQACGQLGDVVQGFFGGQGHGLESGEQVGVGLDGGRFVVEVAGAAGVWGVGQGVRRGVAQVPEGAAQPGVGSGVGGDQVHGDVVLLGQVMQVQQLDPQDFGRCQVPGEGGFVDDQAVEGGATGGGKQAAL